MNLAEQVQKCMMKDGGAGCGLQCEHCGWNQEEYARRKALPLTRCEDGLRRKILPPRAPRPRPNEFGN